MVFILYSILLLSEKFSHTSPSACLKGISVAACLAPNTATKLSFTLLPCVATTVLLFPFPTWLEHVIRTWGRLLSEMHLIYILQTPSLTRAYPDTTPTSLENSFLMFLKNSLCLTGMVEKRLCSATVVPGPLATVLLSTSVPLWS